MKEGNKGEWKRKMRKENECEKMEGTNEERN